MLLPQPWGELRHVGGRMLADGYISEADLGLIHVVDDVDRAVEIIVDDARHGGRGPSRAE